MKRYVIRRLMMAVPLLLAISFICFLFINLIPSNPAEVALRVQQMPVITEEAISSILAMASSVITGICCDNRRGHCQDG